MGENPRGDEGDASPQEKYFFLNIPVLRYLKIATLYGSPPPTKSISLCH